MEISDAIRYIRMKGIGFVVRMNGIGEPVHAAEDAVKYFSLHICEILSKFKNKLNVFSTGIWLFEIL